MELCLTIFNDLEESYGRTQKLTWESFFTRLQATNKLQLHGKTEAKQFSPTVFFNAHRLKKNAQFYSMVVLDFDNNKMIKINEREVPDPEFIPVTTIEVEEIISVCGLEALIYTTSSHCPDKHKFRVCIPLSGTILPEIWRGVMLGIVDEYFSEVKDGIDFMSYRNIALAYYLPYNNAEITRLKGSYINPEPFAIRAEEQRIEEQARLDAQAKSMTKLNTAGVYLYVKKAVDGFNKRLSSIKTTGRNNTIHHEAYSMGRLMNTGKISEADVIQALKTYAMICGLVKDDGEETVMNTIHSGISAGKGNPIILGGGK